MRKLSPNRDFPIFKELEFIISDPALKLGVPTKYRAQATLFYVTTRVITPGFQAKEVWGIIAQDGTLKLGPFRADGNLLLPPN